MRNHESQPETRLSVRLQGPLADHANRQVETALYHSHSEYIRDLIRKDMASGGDAELESSIVRGLSDVKNGRHTIWDDKKSLKEAKTYAAKRHKK